jgi:hypothetical protein
MREHQECCNNIEISQKCAIITVKNIIMETLQEYTNDENHDRINHYNLILHQNNKGNIQKYQESSGHLIFDIYH